MYNNQPVRNSKCAPGTYGVYKVFTGSKHCAVSQQFRTLRYLYLSGDTEVLCNNLVRAGYYVIASGNNIDLLRQTVFRVIYGTVC